MSSQLKRAFEGEIAAAASASEVEELRIKYLGKNGMLTEQMKQLGSIPQQERKQAGAVLNELKAMIAEIIDAKKTFFEKQELSQKLEAESIDVTLPARRRPLGSTHPVTVVMRDLRNIFGEFGFQFVDGPEIEDDWHNFTALNIDENHPARQMHDTFYIKDAPSMLLRTHTSNVQIRAMKSGTPPMRLFTIGKTFRSDSDSTHTPMFHQMEVMYVDKGVTLGNLKYCLEQFLCKFFEVQKAPIRLRSSYFPFTEPSMEVDVQCKRTKDGEVLIGQGDDWIEILGAGMVHPSVLKNCDIDPSQYTGFAFGVGLERLAMLKYNIADIRKFYDGDIRWLKKYNFI